MNQNEKQAARRVLEDVRFELIALADDWNKRFYNTHGQVTHEQCYAKETAYRNAVAIIDRRVSELKIKIR